MTIFSQKNSFFKEFMEQISNFSHLWSCSSDSVSLFKSFAASLFVVHDAGDVSRDIHPEQLLWENYRQMTQRRAYYCLLRDIKVLEMFRFHGIQGVLL